MTRSGITARVDGTLSGSDVEQDLLHLDRIAEIAMALGAVDLACDARELVARLADHRFLVAMVGAFKRGKSSLVNALVGETLLPIGILPVTAIPTVVRFGERVTVRVLIAGSCEWLDIDAHDIVRYVTERDNPSNQRSVRVVEVHVPHPLLAGGLSLVDTPGLGSTHISNGAATRDFLPNIDAAVLVVGVDPSLSAEELELAARIAQQTGDVIIALNKADRFPPQERAIAIAHAVDELAHRLKGRAIPTVEVSATSPNGVTPLHDWLEALAHDRRHVLMANARRRGVKALRDRCFRALEATRLGIWRPISDAEQRIVRLSALVADVSQRMLVLPRRLLEVERTAERELTLQLGERLSVTAIPDHRAILLDLARDVGRVLQQLDATAQRFFERLTTLEGQLQITSSSETSEVRTEVIDDIEHDGTARELVAAAKSGSDAGDLLTALRQFVLEQCSAQRAAIEGVAHSRLARCYEAEDEIIHRDKRWIRDEMASRHIELDRLMMITHELDQW